MNVKLIGKHEKDSRACRDGLALTLDEMMAQDKSICYVDCDLMGASTPSGCGSTIPTGPLRPASPRATPPVCLRVSPPPARRFSSTPSVPSPPAGAMTRSICQPPMPG